MITQSMINIFLVKGFKAGEAVFGLMPGGAYAEVCIYIYNLVLENNNNKKKKGLPGMNQHLLISLCSLQYWKNL